MLARWGTYTPWGCLSRLALQWPTEACLACSFWPVGPAANQSVWRTYHQVHSCVVDQHVQGEA